MSAFTTVFAKECIDNLRDRRTLLSSFSLAILSPILFMGMMTFMLNTVLGESDDPLELAITGAEHAPKLVEFLRQQNTDLTTVQIDDPSGAIRNGDYDLILVIPEDYAKRYSNAEVNAVRLVYDSSNFGRSRRNFSRASSMVSQYGGIMGVLRLHLRGVHPSVAQPLQVVEQDTASPGARALTVLATLPYLLVLVVFMGGFYLAIDTTAGEREHGSLEPLLSQPISRAQLVMGKLFATSAFGSLSLILFLITFALAVPFVPLDRIGMSLEIDALACVAMFLISLPLIVFAAALLTVVASWAKSYKEAQTYLSIIILVPTLPLIIAQLADVQSSWLTALIPSLSQSILIREIISGEGLNLAHVAASVASTGGVAVLLSYLAIWMYRRERILI